MAKAKTWVAADKAIRAAEAAADTPPPAPPGPLSHGSYALYKTPEGGLHLVYRVKGTDQDEHLEIPSFVVKMAAQASHGQDLGALSVLLGEGP